MTKEELAELLNGRQYREEITSDEEKIAYENGLIVIFGASDDLTIFKGIIDTEQDSIRFYILGKNWKRKVETLGKDMGLDFTGELII